MSVESTKSNRQAGEAVSSTDVRTFIASHLGVDIKRVTDEAHFTEDLGADSLALIELVEALEEELGERTVGFTIDDDDLAELKTVRDAVEYVVARLAAMSG